MYTCCPECETTFRLGADDLRRAQGKVRCGECSYVFNALEYLTEDTDDNAAAEPAYNAGNDPVFEPDTAPGNNEFGDELDDEDAANEADAGAGILVTDSGNYDIAAAEAWNEAADTLEEAHPDEIITTHQEEDEPEENESDASIAADDDTNFADDDPHEQEFDDTAWERIPGVGSASLASNAAQLNGDDEDADNPVRASEGKDEAAGTDETDSEVTDSNTNTDDLEFNVPEEKWSNFFGSAPKIPSAPDWEAITASTLGNSQDDAADEEVGGESDNDIDPPGYSSDSSGDWQDTATGSGLNDPLNDADEKEPDESADESSAADNVHAEPIYAFDPDDDLDDESDDYATMPPWQQDGYTPELPQAKPTRSGRWFLAGLLLLIGFTVQLIHYQRDTLAAHPSFGSTVRSVYARLGLDTYPDWPISNYEIRGSEAVAGESGADVLDIRTQIASVGDSATGLPQLRVILRDRWSNPVAARHFNPEEYAVDGDLPENGLLMPNETINAHVSIVDPGLGTQSFELELCLPRRHTGLDCTGQPFQ